MCKSLVPPLVGGRIEIAYWLDTVARILVPPLVGGRIEIARTAEQIVEVKSRPSWAGGLK